MLDPQQIRDAVKANCKNRNVTADVDRVAALDDERPRKSKRASLVQVWYNTRIRRSSDDPRA